MFAGEWRNVRNSNNTVLGSCTYYVIPDREGGSLQMITVMIAKMVMVAKIVAVSKNVDDECHNGGDGCQKSDDCKNGGDGCQNGEDGCQNSDGCQKCW